MPWGRQGPSFAATSRAARTCAGPRARTTRYGWARWGGPGRGASWARSLCVGAESRQAASPPPRRPRLGTAFAEWCGTHRSCSAVPLRGSNLLRAAFAHPAASLCGSGRVCFPLDRAARFPFSLGRAQCVSGADAPCPARIVPCTCVLCVAAGSCRVAEPQSLPYDSEALVWDQAHATNTSNRYCYCGRGRFIGEAMLLCSGCRNFFHAGAPSPAGRGPRPAPVGVLKCGGVRSFARPCLCGHAHRFLLFFG